MDETAKEAYCYLMKSSEIYIVLLKAPYSEVLRPWPSENELSSKAVETENIITIVGLHKSQGLIVVCFNS